MLTIGRKLIEEIYAHGFAEAPLEACGYLVGRDGVAAKYYPMTNTDQSAEHFSLDPQEQFAVAKDARQRGLQILAVAHTHPASPARPSPEDIRLAYDPHILYVIYSLLEPPVIKAFRIRQGAVSEEEIHAGA
ncbi:MAG: M67 family metallopeptidase [Candidatus Margulisbacteria bacterium]|jgi:proteasome lid subunit RPN8/RPN11|nr:M67 family metallopeptidase [Candidatus Margulisiibacteriota bacterium]